jgi:hypothetical protein
MASAIMGGGLAGKNHDRTDKEQDEWLKSQHGGKDMTQMRFNRGGVTQSMDAQPAAYTLSNGKRGFQSDDGQTYYENPENGRWTSHTNSNDYYTFAPQAVAPAAAAPAAVAEPKPDWRDDIDYSKSEGPEGMTTDQIVDNTGMDNWMQMGPQTAGQHINPLVDPSNWQHQVDPQHQQTRNLGRYINPLIDEEMEYRKKQGLLSYASGNGGLI